MKFDVVESKLKTDRSREYLWNKINTPQKIARIEGFKNPKIRKVNRTTYEIKSKEYHALVSFIPKTAVNLTFVGVKNYPLTWFEIHGDKNCTIVHGEHKRMDSGMSPANLKKELAWVKEHFLEELREIEK